MQYRIEDKPAFTIFGIEEIFNANSCSRKDYPHNPHELWDQCHANGTYEKLARDAGRPPLGLGLNVPCKVHGACDYRSVGRERYPYMLCAFTGPDSKTKGYVTAEIPAQTWAVFPSKPFPWNRVTNEINDLYERFYREWLPGSGYEVLWGVGDFEVYGGDTALGTVELWYPIPKKAE